MPELYNCFRLAYIYWSHRETLITSLCDMCDMTPTDIFYWHLLLTTMVTDIIQVTDFGCLIIHAVFYPFLPAVVWMGPFTITSKCGCQFQTSTVYVSNWRGCLILKIILVSLWVSKKFHFYNLIMHVYIWHFWQEI